MTEITQYITAKLGEQNMEWTNNV